MQHRRICRRGCRALGACLVLGIIAAWATSVRAEPPARHVEALSTLEALVQQWSRLRLALADEQRAWDAQKDHWQSEIDLLKKEKAALQAEIESASADLASVEVDRVEALREKERLSQILDGMPPLVERAEASLREWPSRLPPPLRESLEGAFRPLMQEPGATPVGSAPARLQRVVALYTELEQLQRNIHVVKEVLAMPDGSRREVDVCYVGLARAFAVTADDRWAGIGTPDADGWQWTSRAEIADAVRLAVSIHNRERTAALVELPLAIGEDGP